MGDKGVREVIDALDAALGPVLFPPREDGSDPRACPTCIAEQREGGRLGLRISRNGAFIGCSNYPECRFTRPFSTTEGGEGEAATGDRELGVDPQTGRPVWLKTGRFGPYVELSAEDKPKRSSLPKGWAPGGLDLEQALRLLSLPREVGAHPEDGEPILAGLGRYGPYVQHGKTYANVESIEDVFEVGLNRAVTLIAEKRAGGPRGRSAASTPTRVLGAHPTRGDEIALMPGRYGPYLKAGKLNVTLPKGADLDTLHPGGRRAPGGRQGGSRGRGEDRAQGPGQGQARRQGQGGSQGQGPGEEGGGPQARQGGLRRDARHVPSVA